MSQFAKPSGFFGKILAKSMARGHKDFYKIALKVINPKKEDKYLEIGFGSRVFINKYMSQVSKISGIDHSEDMVKLASEINRKRLVRSGRYYNNKNTYDIKLNQEYRKLEIYI